jgi:hypothetical protein
MIKLTFQTEDDYIKFARTACIFTHLRAYNAAAHVWKEEDIPFISKVDDKEFREDNFEEWKKCFEVYDKAEKEYGEDMSYWRGIFEDYAAHTLLYSLGLNYNPDEDGDGVTYVASDLDVDLKTLERNEDFPKSFPCVTCVENGNKYDGLFINHVYLEDFKNESPLLKFDWLEENVRAFWVEGKGSYYGG